ncbi:MAG: SigB/SigF/SigG family RNA polymerase sigma factor [Clostridiales Family XIII bacterium]|jgi:RNA polymerase sigma-B factor|nr:SigB/SigF/SigG family RNA polymerase sigma factor [Clostridiales Family XIII bacterium]
MSDKTEEKRKAKEDTDALFAAYAKHPSDELRNQIVEKYMYLADMLSRKYTGRGIDYDDLYQVASMALVLAVDRFDQGKGFAFTSFATPTIIGEIKRYFRDKSWALKVPRRMKDLVTQFSSAREKLQKENGRPPTIRELAEYMEVSEEDILEAMESVNTYRAYSLDQVAKNKGDDDQCSLDRYISVEESGYESFENADLIKNVMAELSDKERAIFDERMLGMKTQKEVAEEHGVSQVTISRLEAEIREKFRNEYYKAN